MTNTLHSTPRRILSYLIPLRVLRGHLPSQELLDRFPDLNEVYGPFVGAIRKADIKAYDVASVQMGEEAPGAECLACVRACTRVGDERIVPESVGADFFAITTYKRANLAL